MNGDELKDFRRRNDLTQARLAELLDVAANTVARWERDEYSIPQYIELALEAIEARIKTGE